MKKESVMAFVDRRVYDSMVEGFPIACIKKDIETRSMNMSRGLFIKDITPDEFEELLKTDLEKIQSSRIKYTAFYVQHARKRIVDLDWILANKSKFPRLSTSQVFNLIKLKEKLQPKLELSV